MTLVKNYKVDSFQGDHYDGGFVVEKRDGAQPQIQEQVEIGCQGSG